MYRHPLQACIIFGQGQFILTVVQYLFNGGIVVQAIGIGPTAGVYQPFGAYSPGEAQDAAQDL